MNKKASKEKTTTSSVNVCEEEKRPWRQEDVNWFIHFWNEERRKNNARVFELLLMSDDQTANLKRCQARWGKEAVRRAVVNVMRSDYINNRTGKRCVFSLDWFLSKKWFPLISQGKYNDLSVEERPITEDERRQLEAERYRQQQEVRRAQNRAIEEQIREEEQQRRERQQKEWERNKPSQADLKRILGDNWLLD